MTTHYLGIDTGGTFTDFVYVEGDNIRIHKVLSTPEAPERAILQGIAELNIDCENLQIVHGSTVATNAVLERKGAKTLYIANQGFKDVLAIGRQTRKELYNLQPIKEEPIVPAEQCLEINVRLAADGTVLQEMEPAALEHLVKQVNALQVEAVAINLLFSFIDGCHEREIAEALPDHLFVCCSHDVLPEYKEYERGITTWLNAYVGPLLKGYLDRLQQQTAPAGISVMRSSGQTTSASTAGNEAVHLLLSGPAGGLSAARLLSDLTGQAKLLSFDMGGTSTDVAMYDGKIVLGQAGRIADLPVAVPMVDIHTIGAGGGSQAWVDAGGALLVGPQSAGAKPGPACYGQGGSQPTVTDANLLLGHLPQSTRLGGSLPLDFAAAEASMQRLMKSAGLSSAAETAEGIVHIVNAAMAQALRVISLEQGIDPAEFTLLAFGGAGGLHICAVAEALNMRSAMVPVNSGVLSALGMLTAPMGRELSRTLGKLLSECTDDEVNRLLNELFDNASEAIGEEGIDSESLQANPSVDICYRGQSSSLNLAWSSLSDVAEEFNSVYQARYGQLLDSELELVTIRQSVNSAATTLHLPEHQAITAEKEGSSQVYGIQDPVPVLQRKSLQINQIIHGPAIIVDEVSTTWVSPEWRCRMDALGNLFLNC